MMFSNSNITRSIFTCIAYAYRFNGMNPDGTPNMVRVHSDPFKTTNANDKVTAKRAMKETDGTDGYIAETLTIEVQSEVVIAMTLEDFYTYGDAVIREANGRVKKS